MTRSPLAAGQEIAGTILRLDVATVQGYLSAVEETSPLYRENRLVPPTAIATLGIRVILEKLALPSGTLHAAQELSMCRAVAIDEEVSCTAKIAQCSIRGDWQFAVVEFTVRDKQGEAIQEGRTTLLVPQQNQ